MCRITEITINNFLSIRNLTIKIDKSLILIGRNNVGKSNILKAIDVFFDMSSTTYTDDYFYGKNTNNPITISITFNEKIDCKSSTIIKYIRIKDDGKIKSDYYWESHNDDNLIKNINKNLKSILPSTYFLKDVKYVNEETALTNTTFLGKLFNELLLPSVSTNIDDKSEELQNLLNNHEFFIELNNVLQGSGNFFNNSISLQFQTMSIKKLFSLNIVNEKDEYNVDVEKLGSGLRRNIMYSILQLYAKYRSKQNKKSRIFLFEEPELHLHPQAQRETYKIINKLSKNDQVLYTTHSEHLFDIDDYQSICFVEKSMHDETSVQMPTQSMDPIIQNLRGLSGYMNKYNRAFFANKIVLVEGMAEEISLHNFAKKVDQDFITKNIDIISCDGVGNIQKLYELYSQFISCYKIFDSDGYFNKEERIKLLNECNSGKKPMKKLKMFDAEKNIRKDIINDTDEELPIDFKSTSSYTVFKQDYNDKLKETMDKDYDRIYENIKKTNELRMSAVKTKTAIQLSIECEPPNFIKTILKNIDSLD